MNKPVFTWLPTPSDNRSEKACIYMQMSGREEVHDELLYTEHLRYFSNNVQRRITSEPTRCGCHNKPSPCWTIWKQIAAQMSEEL